MKRDAPEVVQRLVNAAMAWAEGKLREHGSVPAASVCLPRGGGAGEPEIEPEIRTVPEPAHLTLAEQEQRLTAALQEGWRRGELAAVLLAAPVLYGRAGQGERSEAVRLHIETPEGYCADVLMPYRVRPAKRWRGQQGNRVHFTHPVAQESDSRFGAMQATKPGN